MPVKSFHAPHLGRSVKLGRRRPVALGPHLKLSDYLLARLPAPPASVDYHPKATASLQNIFQNDQLGDCVIAAGYHCVGVWTGNADGGAPWIPSDHQIVADYSAIGDYVPGDSSTDNGCDEVTALNYWQSHGFADGSKLAGWLKVDATNKNEIAAAIWLFENLFFGMSLPDAWVDPFPSGDGFTWDVAGDPIPENGHAIMGCGYSADGIAVDSWGLMGTLTWGAIAKYAQASAGGELYVLLSEEQLLKGQQTAPNGVAWRDLVLDFDALGGHVPVPPAPAPAPTPAPTPTPTPTPAPTGVTLQQAITWAQSKLPAYWMTRRMAQNSIALGLTANWPKS